MRLPDWCYSKPKLLRFPVWLLNEDIVELDGQVYRFHGVIRRFKDLEAMRQYFASAKQEAKGK